MDPLLEIPLLSAAEVAQLTAADRSAREAQLLAAAPAVQLFLTAPSEIRPQLAKAVTMFVDSVKQLWSEADAPSEVRTFLQAYRTEWS